MFMVLLLKVISPLFRHIFRDPIISPKFNKTSEATDALFKQLTGLCQE